MITTADVDIREIVRNVDVNDKEVRISSVELVELVNDFRGLESNITGKKKANLRHDSFITKIKKELEVLELLETSNDQNILEDEYVDIKGEVRPCYSLNRDGMLQMLNSESAIVRAKTIEYINKLEEEIKRPRRLSAKEELRLHYQVIEEQYQVIEEQYQVIEEQDERITEIDKKVEDLKGDMPLFNVECKELQSLVRKIGIKALGGYKSSAYNDNSIRGKVYADIQSQLKREFDVSRYEAIKRKQLKQAKEIVSSYKAPLVLSNKIHVANRQIRILEGGK